MKGVVVAELSKTFEEAISKKVQVVDSVPVPTLSGDDDILVRVKAASVNFFDLLMLTGKYQYKPQLPFVLLTEAAGDVVSVGSAVRGYKPGDRVVFSTGVHGAACDQVIVSTKQVQHLPAKLSYAQGAGFLMGYKTAYHGLVHRGGLKKGEWLLVTGAGGGMGLAAVQLGKALGARVIAAASDDKKLQICKQEGADFVVNYTDKKSLKDKVDAITNGDLCDVIYDPVGGDVFDQCVRCVSTKGGARLLVIGFAEGRIPTLPVNMALIKGFSLVGVRMGGQMLIDTQLNSEMETELFAMANKGLLKPYIFAEVPADDAKRALTMVADRSVIGKVVVTFNSASPKSKL